MLNPNHLAHLKEQFSRARPVLFTGAGFSYGLKNIMGEGVPLGQGLKEKLWPLCADGAFEPTSTLQDLFEAAKIRNEKALGVLLTQCFSIDAASITEVYKEIFSLPWHRCYTLNIDNLESQVEAKFQLPRKILVKSAEHYGSTASPEPADNVLEVVHLNGVLEDVPDKVTFSRTQFTNRLTRPEPWFVQLTADLLSRPVIFIGTELDEPSLWQHILLRQQRGPGSIELRPKSYLVKPDLLKAREMCLSQFNIQWVNATCSAFFDELTPKLIAESAQGHAYLTKFYADKRDNNRLKEVSELAVHPNQTSDFLLGQEPIWADIQSSRAIVREIDHTVLAEADRILKQLGKRDVLVITGTAGTGKSTTAMRLGIQLNARGLNVGWIDQNSNVPPFEIRKTFSAATRPQVLIIDDADIYGSELANIVRDLNAQDKAPLIVVALREVRMDKCMDSTVLRSVKLEEVVIPMLTDPDITKLIDVLDANHRLGRLKGLARSEQERLFKLEAGRQLLVAMIQATSGEKLTDKVCDELTTLETENQIVYGLICVASHFKYPLSRTEIMIASGANNTILNYVDKLLKRHVIVKGDNDRIRARHKVIASIIFEKLRTEGRLLELLEGLAVAAATQCATVPARTSPVYLFLKKLINHDLFIKCSDVEVARNVYAGLENQLTGHPHFWLQRGSLELEQDNLALAENFLNQASSMDSGDLLIATQQAHMLFRKAIKNYTSPDAQDFVDKATTILFSNMTTRGEKDPHPYHIYGQNGLLWCKKTMSNPSERAAYISKLQEVVNKGLLNHPKAELLQNLKKELHDAYLGSALL